MHCYLGEVQFHSRRHVYQAGDAYRVEQVGQNGRRSIQVVPDEAVAYLRDRLKGYRVELEDVRREVQAARGLLEVPATQKGLHEMAQGILIVLVARGHATEQREGVQVLYDIL